MAKENIIFIIWVSTMANNNSKQHVVSSANYWILLQPWKKKKSNFWLKVVIFPQISNWKHYSRWDWRNHFHFAYSSISTLLCFIKTWITNSSFDCCHLIERNLDLKSYIFGNWYLFFSLLSGSTWWSLQVSSNPLIFFPM